MPPEPSAARFVTKPLSLWLDLVRGAAALAVVVGHAVQLGLYTGPWPFSILFQHNAVIVFFVLSGVVIATSVEGRATTLRDYALARATRILQVALPAITLSLAAAALAGWLDPASAVPVKWEQAALAALFLSESIGPGWAINPPFWSLCYEVWFYALFAAATFLKGRTRAVWLALLAALAGPNVLLLLPAWLVGVHVARNRGAREIRPLQGALHIGLALVCVLLISRMAQPVHEAVKTIAPWNLGYALFAPTDIALALAVGLGFVGLRPLVANGSGLPGWSVRPIRYLAGISFSIYLLHWPLLTLARAAGLSGGDSAVRFAALLAGTIAVCAGFAALTEQRRHALRALADRMLAAPPGKPAPAALP